MSDRPLLSVANLRVRFQTPTRIVEAVRGIGFAMGREKLGIVGESGSGKSMTARAILRLVPPPGEGTAERLAFEDIDLLAADDRTIRRLRGPRVSLVFQDATFSLNPGIAPGHHRPGGCPLQP